METIITRLTREHFPGALKLLQDISSFDPLEDDYESIWQSFIEQSNIFPIQATSEDKLVGCGFLITATRVRGGKVGYLEDIAVLPNYRAKGIGRMIVNALVDIARSEGCFKVTLQCDGTNSNFYEGLSFFQTDQITMCKFFDDGKH